MLEIYKITFFLILLIIIKVTILTITPIIKPKIDEKIRFGIEIKDKKPGLYTPTASIIAKLITSSTASV